MQFQCNAKNTTQQNILSIINRRTYYYHITYDCVVIPVGFSLVSLSISMHNYDYLRFLLNKICQIQSYNFDPSLSVIVNT